MTRVTPTSSVMIAGFPDSEAQAKSLAGCSGLMHAQITVRRFPDGESYVRLPEQLPPHVIFFCSLHQANDRLIELFLAAATARKKGVERLSLVAPYLCYMRQDSEFNKGEAVSQSIIGDLLAQHFDDLLTVDPHLHRTAALSAAMPVKNTYTLTASHLISEFIADSLDDLPLILGPDAESEQWARQIAEAGNFDYAIAEKTRYGDREVKVELPPMDIGGRHIVIIDDISSTGNTLIQAASTIDSRQVKSIQAAVTHALLDEPAMKALQQAGFKSVWSCNTIPHPSNVIDIEPVLVQALNEFLR